MFIDRMLDVWLVTSRIGNCIKWLHLNTGEARDTRIFPDSVIESTCSILRGGDVIQECRKQMTTW